MGQAWDYSSAKVNVGRDQTQLIIHKVLENLNGQFSKVRLPPPLDIYLACTHLASTRGMDICIICRSSTFVYHCEQNEKFKTGRLVKKGYALLHSNKEKIYGSWLFLLGLNLFCILAAIAYLLK